MTSGATSGVTLLRRRPVAAFVTMVALSSLALSSATTALSLWVFDLTGRELHLGLLGLAEFLPGLLLVVVSGSLSDRGDRLAIARWCYAGEVACFAVLAGMARFVPSVWSVLGVVMGLGVARAIAAPSVRSLPADLVSRDELPALVALYAFTWQSASIVGPVVGATLFVAEPTAAFGVAAALGAGALGASFGTTGARAHDREPVAGSPSWSDALLGVRVVVERPILLGAISLDLFAVLFGGAVALLPALAEQRLGIGPSGVGWLRALGGAGAALSAALLARRPLTGRVGTWLFAAVAVFGAATVGLGLARGFVMAAIAIVALSAADAVSVFVRASVVPLAVPDHARGRVLAVEQVFIGASNELGAFESGVAGELLGAAGAVVAGGVATLVVVAVWARAFPALRTLDTFADVSADHGGSRPSDQAGRAEPS